MTNTFIASTIPLALIFDRKGRISDTINRMEIVDVIHGNTTESASTLPWQWTLQSMPVVCGVTVRMGVT